MFSNFRKVVKHELIVGNHFKQLLNQKIQLKAKHQLYLDHQNLNQNLDNKNIRYNMFVDIYIH